MAFTPFFQGTDATNLIQGYLNKNITANTPFEPADMNANDVFRNPYSPEGFYANETDMYPVDTYKPPVEDDEGIPNCEEGYVYDEVLKSCRFVGFSEPTREKDDREDPDPREYYSIKDMEKMDDYEFLDYLTGAGAYMTGKDGMYTLNNPMMSTLGIGLNLFGLNSSDIRNKFMKKKLAELGYNFTNNKQGEPVYNLTTPMGIINNAQSANKLMTGDQKFTDPEIAYQVQAKMDNVRGSQNNPDYTYTKPQMTEQQVIEDAVKSGATSVNPFERFGINQSVPQNYTDTQIQGGAGKFNKGNPFI